MRLRWTTATLQVGTGQWIGGRGDLGEARDFEVELESGERLRILAPPSMRRRLGEQVEVFLPVQSCRVVSE